MARSGRPASAAMATLAGLTYTLAIRRVTRLPTAD
jgi:hypothetical protein